MEQAQRFPVASDLAHRLIPAVQPF